MWTKEHRKRQAGFERRRHPSDLTDAEWERIEPLLSKPARCGHKPNVDLREILNAVRYLARAGCSWRMLPIHFGPWQTVYSCGGLVRLPDPAGGWQRVGHDDFEQSVSWLPVSG